MSSFIMSLSFTTQPTTPTLTTVQNLKQYLPPSQNIQNEIQRSQMGRVICYNSPSLENSPRPRISYLGLARPKPRLTRKNC